MIQRKNHLDELARKFNVNIDYDEFFWNKDDPHVVAFAHTSSSIAIHGWNVLNQESYFAGLHEFGHIVLGTHSGLYEDLFEDEAEAWEWAFDNSLEKASDATIFFVSKICLGSYLRHDFLEEMIPGPILNRFAKRIGMDIYTCAGLG